MDKNAKNIEILEKAFQNRDLPVVYFNGFIVSVGAGDVAFVLKQGDEPILILNASHIVAKTLVAKLGHIFTEVEQALGTTFMTTDDFDNKMKESKSNDGDD